MNRKTTNILCAKGAAAGLCLATAPVSHAATNAIPASVLASETVVLGGPFDHGNAAGDPSNSTTSAAFVGGFNANEVRIEGDISGVLAFQGNFFFGEGDVVVTAPDASTTVWQNPAGTVADDGLGSTTAYNFAVPFAPAAAAAGTWNFEFIDTFDDGAGADSISENVSVTLSELIPASDTNGVFSLGALTNSASAADIGEFAVAGVFDSYPLTLADPGLLTIETDVDPTGLLGGTVDTEIGLFDATDTMIAYSDDDGNGLYSLLTDLDLAAGDYTLVVSGFGSNIAAGGVGTLQLGAVTGGTATGDYSLSLSLIPEPSTAVLGGIALLGFLRRRR